MHVARRLLLIVRNLLLTILVTDGYIYYDLFNQILGSNMVRLISPVIPVTDEPQLCFSFWYAAFGAGESALLQIMRQDNSSGETPAEKVRGHQLTIRPIKCNKSFYIAL